MVASPSKRLRAKTDAPLVEKRFHKYCQNDTCVFNRQCPGQPASKAAGVSFCVWCDQSLLAQALQATGTEMQIKVALECFKKKNLKVYRLAMEKLDGHEVHNKRFCSGMACVFSTAKPGDPARVPPASDACRWCDPDALEVAKGSIEGRKRLNQA